MPTYTPLLPAALLAALTSAAPTYSQVPADRFDAALAWAQCIRDSGYGDFPDPDAEGGFQFIIDRDRSELFGAATDACRQLAPEGMREDGMAPEQLDALIELAQCVRASGITDFPDPGPMGNFDLSGLGVEQRDSPLDAAISKCRLEGGTGDIQVTIGG